MLQFILGCSGALILEMLHLKQLKANRITEWSRYYLILSSFLIVTSGLFVYVLDPKSFSLAFFMGMIICVILILILYFFYSTDRKVQRKNNEYRATDQYQEFYFWVNVLSIIIVIDFFIEILKNGSPNIFESALWIISLILTLKVGKKLRDNNLLKGFIKAFYDLIRYVI